MSQRELAKTLGVTDMTISRIEAGQNYISAKVADAFSDLMKWEDFDLITQHDPQAAKIKRFFFEKHPEYIQENAYEASRNWRDELCDALDSTLFVNGFSVESSRGVGMPYDRLYFDGQTHKSWAFFFSISLNQNTAYDNTFLQLLSALGYTHFIAGTGIHKISLVTTMNDSHRLLEEMASHQLDDIPCDFSVFSYCIGGKLQAEIDLSVLGDGRGLYDMDSPDEAVRSVAIQRFTRWKRSLL